MRKEFRRAGALWMAAMLLFTAGFTKSSFPNDIPAKPGVPIFLDQAYESTNGCFTGTGTWTDIAPLPIYGNGYSVLLPLREPPQCTGNTIPYNNALYYGWIYGGVAIPCQTKDTLLAQWDGPPTLIWTFVYFPQSLTAYYSLCGPGGTGRSGIWWYMQNGLNTIHALWTFPSAQPSAPSGNWQPSSVVVGSVPSNWSVVGQSDFNGDSTTDVLWYDNSSGNISIWFMNGAQLGSVASASAVGNAPTNWTVLGADDFNNDGIADILWGDNSGNLAIWLMSGTQPGSVASVIPLGNVPTTWSVVRTADFNHDGTADILWQDSSGNVAIWFMQAGQPSSEVFVGNVPTSWAIAGVGYFNGAFTCILWRDTSGNVAIWAMSGAQVVASTFLGNVPTTWSIVDIGDFAGSGTSDIVWRDTSGNIAIWEMSGGGSVTSANSVGNVPTTWSIVPVGSK